MVHSDTPRTGWFECSDELVNQLWRNINWSQRGNFLSVPTDCPQRDERLGWLADAQVFLPTAALNMDVAAFMTKWGYDILDAQLARRRLHRRRAPADRRARRRAGLERRRGHRAVDAVAALRRPARCSSATGRAMERYMDYLLRHNPDLLWTARRGNDYGDWLSVGEQTPREVLATAYWAYDALLMSEMARRARPCAIAPSTTGACEQGSAPPSTRRTSATTPTSKATRRPSTCSRCTWTCCPRSCGRAPRSAWSRTSARNGGHLTTGFVGVGLLCPTLSDARLRRRRPRAADQGHVPIVGVLDPPRRDHDLGALGRLDRGSRLPDRRR